VSPNWDRRRSSHRPLYSNDAPLTTGNRNLARCDARPRLKGLAPKICHQPCETSGPYGAGGRSGRLSAMRLRSTVRASSILGRWCSAGRQMPRPASQDLLAPVFRGLRSAPSAPDYRSPGMSCPRCCESTIRRRIGRRRRPSFRGQRGPIRIERHNENPKPYRWTTKSSPLSNASAKKPSRRHAANFRFM
jgi:hypothetical protein